MIIVRIIDFSIKISSVNMSFVDRERPLVDFAFRTYIYYYNLVDEGWTEPSGHMKNIIKDSKRQIKN